MRHQALLPHLVFSLVIQAQAPLTLNAPITRVRVHPDEAWITRTGSIQLPAGGAWRLEMEDLPQGTHLEDLRMTAAGMKGLRLGDVSLMEADASAAERRTRELALRLMPQEIRHETLKAEIATLRRAAEVRATEAQGRPQETAQLIEAARTLHSRLGELLLAERQLARKLESARKVEPIGPRASLEVVASGPGTVEVTLQVRTRQARWKPSYEARLNADRTRMELVLFGTVTQSSGSPWPQVALELCTAPGRSTSPEPTLSDPALLSWTQSPPPPPPLHPMQDVVPEIAPRALPKENLSLAYAGGVAPEPALEPPALGMDRSGVGTTFLLEGPRTVAADTRPHRFRITSAEVSPALAYVAIPRQDPGVYLEARIPLPDALPLYPGAPLVPFLGEQRLASRPLPSTPAGDPLRLALGQAEGLSTRLERVSASLPYRLVRTETRGHGRQVVTTTRVDTTGRERTWLLEERLVVASRDARELEVEVLDRPVRSQHEKVTVQQQAQPTVESPSARLRWALKVPARGRSEILLKTRITGPREGELLGLGTLELE